MVGLHQISRGLVSCQRCNANGYRRHMVCTVYMLFHLHGLHEAHRADIEFCICRLMYAFKMLVSSTVCYEAIAACKEFKLYIGTISLHYLCIFKHLPRTSGSASSNAKSALPVIITPVLAFSPLESAPSSRSRTYSRTDRLMSPRMSLRKHPARLQLTLYTEET